MSKRERAELDALLREVLMVRVGAVRFEENGPWTGRCERCMRVRPLQVSHIEPKGRVPALRWDAENVVALCSACHLFWWHKAPREAEEWITAHLGADRRERLAFRARTIRGGQDYLGVKMYLTAQRIRAAR